MRSSLLFIPEIGNAMFFCYITWALLSDSVTTIPDIVPVFSGQPPAVEGRLDAPDVDEPELGTDDASPEVDASPPEMDDVPSETCAASPEEGFCGLEAPSCSCSRGAVAC